MCWWCFGFLYWQARRIKTNFLNNAFCNVTAAAINWDKSSGFWQRECEIKKKKKTFNGLSSSSLPGNYLGVPLHCHRESAAYWSGVLKDMENKGSEWVHRDIYFFQGPKYVMYFWHWTCATPGKCCISDAWIYNKFVVYLRSLPGEQLQIQLNGITFLLCKIRLIET